MFINLDGLSSRMAFQQPTDNPIKHRFSDFGKDRVQIAKWTVTVRDAYNLMYAYTMVHDWLVEEGWASKDEADFGETYYTQRESPKHGKEIWIRWRLQRQPEGVPKAKLFTYMMDLNWKIIGMKPTEIVYRGQKVKADRGEFELDCTAALVFDKDAAWAKSMFKPVKEWMIKRVLEKQRLMHMNNIYNDTYRLRALVTNYLKLETFLPEKEAGEFYLQRTLE